MNYYIIPAALIITFVSTMLIFFFTKRPMRGLWLFFLLIFLTTWAGQLWITPFGPVSWGIAWIPLILVSVVSGILLLALLPAVPATKKTDNTNAVEEGAFIAIGVVFWILLILLVIALVAGHYRTSTIIAS